MIRVRWITRNWNAETGLDNAVLFCHWEALDVPDPELQFSVKLFETHYVVDHSGTAVKEGTIL